jgi:hypothetical protein
LLYVAIVILVPLTLPGMYNRKLVFAAACLGMLFSVIVFLSLGSVNNFDMSTSVMRYSLCRLGVPCRSAYLPCHHSKIPSQGLG